MPSASIDELRVAQALRARGPVRHPNTEHVAGAQRLRGQKCHERAVHAAREADDDLFEPAPPTDLVANELDEPAAGESGIDRERISGDVRDRPHCRRIDRRPRCRGALPGSSVAIATIRPPRRMEGAEEMGKPHFQIGQQGQINPGPGDLLEIERGRDDRLLENRAAGDDVAPGVRNDRAAWKGLAPLEAHELREGDEDAVLPGDVLDDPSPPGQAGRPAGGVVGGHDTARRTRAGNDDELSAAERRQHRRERVPRILADQNRGTSPARVERLHAPSRFHEAFLIEDAVGRKEHLAVHVTDAGVRSAERGVQAGVVEPVPMDLVESEGNVEWRRLGVGMLAGQVVEQPFGRESEIANTALQEVACKSGFGRDEELGRLRPCRDFAKDRAELAQVLVVGALTGPHLGDSEAKHERNVYFMTCSGISLPGAPSVGQPDHDDAS